MTGIDATKNNEQWNSPRAEPTSCPSDECPPDGPRCLPATPLETVCCQCPEGRSLWSPGNWRAKHSNGLGQNANHGRLGLRVSAVYPGFRWGWSCCSMHHFADCCRTLTNTFSYCCCCCFGGGGRHTCYFKIRINSLKQMTCFWLLNNFSS